MVKVQPFGLMLADTKRKELVGEFMNAGREWRAAGEPVPIRVHDFIDRRLVEAHGKEAYPNATQLLIKADAGRRQQLSLASVEGLSFNASPGGPV